MLGLICSGDNGESNVAIYNLGKVLATTNGRGDFSFDFNIIRVQDRPLVTFAFETRAEADAAHLAMQRVVERAILITRPIQGDSRTARAALMAEWERDCNGSHQ
jgi:hypothetical protein